jgi:hypothetical protein
MPSNTSTSHAKPRITQPQPCSLFPFHHIHSQQTTKARCPIIAGPLVGLRPRLRVAAAANPVRFATFPCSRRTRECVARQRMLVPAERNYRVEGVIGYQSPASFRIKLFMCIQNLSKPTHLFEFLFIVRVVHRAIVHYYGGAKSTREREQAKSQGYHPCMKQLPQP